MQPYCGRSKISCGRGVSRVLRQDLSVGRDHDQLGRKLPQYAECFPVAHFERLIDRQVLC